MNNNSLNPTAFTSPRFRGEVLQKIYRVWLFRKLLPVVGVEIVAFAAALYLLAKISFVERIIQNGTRVLFENPPAFLGFLISGFLNASIAKEALVVLLAVIVAFGIRHITQGILRFILVRQNYFSRVTGAQDKR